MEKTCTCFISKANLSWQEPLVCKTKEWGTGGSYKHPDKSQSMQHTLLPHTLYDELSAGLRAKWQGTACLFTFSFLFKVSMPPCNVVAVSFRDHGRLSSKVQSANSRQRTSHLLLQVRVLCMLARNMAPQCTSKDVRVEGNEWVLKHIRLSVRVQPTNSW